jgi:hypothetical protein
MSYPVGLDMAEDPTRGSGPGQVTEAVTPDLDAPAGEQKNEASGSMEPDASGGGCLKFGSGCLPVVAGIVMLPAGLVG